MIVWYIYTEKLKVGQTFYENTLKLSNWTSKGSKMKNTHVWKNHPKNHKNILKMIKWTPKIKYDQSHIEKISENKEKYKKIPRKQIDPKIVKKSLI